MAGARNGPPRGERLRRCERLKRHARNARAHGWKTLCMNVRTSTASPQAAHIADFSHPQTKRQHIGVSLCLRTTMCLRRNNRAPAPFPKPKQTANGALHAYTRHDMRMGRLRGDYAACVSSRLCFLVRAGSVHKLCNASTVQTGRPSGRDCGSRPRTCARGSPPFTSLRSAPEGLRCSCSAAVLNCRRACLPTSQAARLQPALRALKSLGRYPWQVDAQKGARGGLTCRFSSMSVFVHV